MSDRNAFDTFDTDPIPAGGAIPFEPGIIRPERRREVRTSKEDGKGNQGRDFNESPLLRLLLAGKLTDHQGRVALTYLEAYYKAYPTQSHEYKPRQDGGGAHESEYSLAAEQRILRCGQLMDSVRYKALQMFVIDEAGPYELGRKFGRGWGARSVTKRIGEVLDELSDVWPQTRVNQNAR